MYFVVFKKQEGDTEHRYSVVSSFMLEKLKEKDIIFAVKDVSSLDIKSMDKYDMERVKLELLKGQR